MKKYLSLISAFFIMLCLGSIYAWSLVASELIEDFQFTASQTQIIFGGMIAVFPVTMIVVGNWGHLLPIRYIGYASALTRDAPMAMMPS
jgi:OFA family oxalate/formate antiporter-like MFS transporter